MKPIPENFNVILKDIKYIRSAIEQNGDKLRQVIYTRPYRILFWFGGIGILLLSFLIYYFSRMYGSFDKMPSEIRIILIGTAAALFIISGLIKSSSLGFLKKLYPDASIVNMVIKLIGRPLLMTYMVIGALMICFSVYFILGGQAHFIFPVVTIGVGILFVIIGNQFALFELSLSGLLSIIPGVLSVLFLGRDPVSVWIWTSGTVGLAFFTLGAVVEIKLLLKKNRKE